MIDLTGVSHHPAIEDIVDVLCAKTQNTDRGFFRTEVAYFLGKMAACMRATIVTKDRGDIPVNIYALALASSGYGKGHSVNIVENEFMGGFQKRFMEETLPVIADQHLWSIAKDRAIRNNTPEDEEYQKVSGDYVRSGEPVFTFDSGTPPAVKQLRHRLQLANCGAINLQIDEIGSNLIGAVDVLTLFLELYDQGLVKQKLTKNTAENTRSVDVGGKTPTNMLLFGTPAKLLDGGQTEEQFYSMLETGYARRCLFGIGQEDRKAFHTQSAAEIYAKLIQPGNAQAVQKWAAHFHKLADPAMFGWKILVEDAVAIELLEYKIACEQAAEAMKAHEEIRKAEMNHRYFKALKLAGALAFLDESTEVESEHLKQAILLVEESGAAFQKILAREKAHIKLAKYIADVGTEVTHSDLLEALPYYAKSNAGRNEMMNLAMAWGYKNHIIVKKTFTDGIEFFKGEALRETDLSQMRVSYGEHWAYDYLGEEVPFEELHQLVQAPGYHWANHHFKNGHRSEENALLGFNMIVIDVDKGTSLATVHELMKDYKYLTYTTKRHQVPVTDKDGNVSQNDRFRILLPINYHLELDRDEYKEFMDNVCAWLPFKNTDEEANQRSRKWMSHEHGTHHYNLEGQILDALPFVPKTSKNEEHKAEMKAVASLDNLERWFAQRIASGNRNNQMIKYALALVDGGHSLVDVNRMVLDFNKKLSNPLSEQELASTVLTTVGKRFQAKP